MSGLYKLALALAVAMLFAGAAHAEKRVALVLGNGSYKLISALANPVNDAKLMAEALKIAGFEVHTAFDSDYPAMRRAVRKFGRALRRAGKDAVGLLYYAGHGVQARGQNYLIPLGAQIESTADLDLEALSATQALSQMEEAGNRLNLVILDACRNNPFVGSVRSSGRGLARIQAASGALIAFSAAPGQVALDGDGINSPYTSALATAIQKPGLLVEQVFKQVRNEVERETGGRQTPWEESSLKGDFYFTPGRSETSSSTTTTEKPASDASLELAFWNSVKDSRKIDLLQAYLDKYPKGTFERLARFKIKVLKRTPDSTPSTAPTETTEPKPLTMAAKLKMVRGQPPWQISGMFQGYLVAYAANRNGAIFRATCNVGSILHNHKFVSFSVTVPNKVVTGSTRTASLIVTIDQTPHQFRTELASSQGETTLTVTNNGTREGKRIFSSFHGALVKGIFLSVEIDRLGINEVFSLRSADSSLTSCKE